MWTVSPNLSVLELAWTTIAIIGAALGVGFLGHVWLSYRAVCAWIERGWARRWGPRHKFVLGFLVGAALLLCVWLGFIALGVNAGLNAPPTTPDRTAASERGGLILVYLEAAMLGVTALLLGAWVVVGKPVSSSGGELTTFSDLFEAQTDAGREMAHVIADAMQPPLGTLDLIAHDPRVPTDVREMAALAVGQLEVAMANVRTLHGEIKRRGGVA